MVVIEGGRDHVNEQVSATVTSVLQTSAGRMVFGALSAEWPIARNRRGSRAGKRRRKAGRNAKFGDLASEMCGPRVRATCHRRLEARFSRRGDHGRRRLGRGGRRRASTRTFPAAICQHGLVVGVGVAVGDEQAVEKLEQVPRHAQRAERFDACGCR